MEWGEIGYVYYWLHGITAGIIIAKCLTRDTMGLPLYHPLQLSRCIIVAVRGVCNCFRPLDIARWATWWVNGYWKMTRIMKNKVVIPVGWGGGGREGNLTHWKHAWLTCSQARSWGNIVLPGLILSPHAHDRTTRFSIDWLQPGQWGNRIQPS